jgi:hypothetical protein
MPSPLPQPGVRDRESAIDAAIRRAAHLLPAQGPISVFVHHNTLHAFEDLPFERAVVEAGAHLGCEPYLTEDRYRAELARGRIREVDLRRSLELDLADGAAEPIGSWGTRLDLRLLLLRHAVETPRVRELRWRLGELDELRRLRADVTAAARARLLDSAPAVRTRRRERAVLEALWAACTRAAASAPAELAVEPPKAALRHRDLLLAATGADSDDLVHPVLIRLCAAFLDQGMAHWPLIDRELGLYRAFLRLYAPPGGPPDRWMRDRLPALIAGEAAAVGELDSIARSLDALGVPEARWQRYVTGALLALRGWAGMIGQIESRPDRVPAQAPPASLAGFLAVRLLLERAALAHLAAAELGFTAPLSGLAAALAARQPPPEQPASDQVGLAYVMFQLAQLLGRTPDEVLAIEPANLALLRAELEAFDQLERRRMFQLAYERHHRVEVLDALALATGSAEAAADPVDLMAIFCIDEREESIRRHLEEVAPTCETFGAAGFFGVAMYYRGLGDAHPVPLCPIALVPVHEVEEVPLPGRGGAERRRQLARRAVGQLAARLQLGSRTLTRGVMITTLLGALAALPLVARVLFPRTTSLLRRRATQLVLPGEDTELAIERREDVQPALGAHAGFTVDEMAGVVGCLLEDIGLAGGAARPMARLVLVLGHGSSSLNNPHESAHDCGACGGGRGGPSARAFAAMANDDRVRARLRERGIVIPDQTWFVGGMHNSCDDSIALYDVDRVGEAWQPALQAARDALDEARARNAHERARRFESAPPSWLGPQLALAHVEARSEDLAQVRPEYGHASNAVAVVGRRQRTRGLFLDRRAFLVSYDPSRDDPDASVLARLLAAVVPVCAGINLEYYFGYVDPTGYGCGSKLPHNVTAYLGVMDGHASDLRTGLPWQMVEIHEPVRLSLIVETRPDTLVRLAADNRTFQRLIENRWIRVATLDPDSPAIHVFGTGGIRPHDRERSELPVVRDSAAWYRGQRDHLGCARIDPSR